jgi:hypothetical protein
VCHRDRLQIEEVHGSVVAGALRWRAAARGCAPTAVAEIGSAVSPSLLLFSFLLLSFC